MSLSEFDQEVKKVKKETMPRKGDTPFQIGMVRQQFIERQALQLIAIAKKYDFAKARTLERISSAKVRRARERMERFKALEQDLARIRTTPIHLLAKKSEK